MNLDFHVHGLLTKKSRFNEKLFLQGIENAKEQGLQGYILCEHFNAKHIFEVYEYLQENHEYVGDKYNVNGFSVFLGMEVDIKGGGHIILSGNRSEIMAIRGILNKHIEKPNFIEFEKLLDIGESHSCMMIGSHPYRDTHKLHLQPKSLLSRLHGLDLNATDIFNKGLSITEEEVKYLSNIINVPYVTGSDSHYPVQLGSVKTMFKEEFLTVKDIIKGIQSREYKIDVSKALDIKVFAAKTTKKMIKENLI